MANERLRGYYTKGQTINGLHTNGGEWMYVDGTEYTGQYHRYTTGEVFTQPSYVNGISKKLIPYIDVIQINQQNELGIDINRNFEYDGIKKITLKPSAKPNPAFVQPTDKDRVKGYFTRYFAVKANGSDIIEITSKDTQGQGSENGLDANLYNTFSIRWKISGPINDILDGMGNIKEAGVSDTNIRTINVKSETYPPLKKYITNFLEFYQ